MTETVKMAPRVNSPQLTSPDLLAWKKATIRDVVPKSDRHIIHSYFTICPESPDGRYVLFYTSTTQDGEKGDLRLVERATGRETRLASDLSTEDAHRAACQQWSAGGRYVVFHDLRQGHWVVVAVEVATGKERVLAQDRQLGFGAPSQPWVPLYGCHWNPGEHRGLELANVETGEIRQAILIEDVLRHYGDQIPKLVGEGDFSIAFPTISPDGGKVFFKIASSHGGRDFRSMDASRREGKFVYDLMNGTAIAFFRHWGHPSWSPDSRGIFEKGNCLTDLKTGRERAFAPGSPSDHPSINPVQDIFVSDGNFAWREAGKPGEVGIILGCLDRDEFITILRFDNTHGAASWRHNHPHPVFSADGKRLYFNMNDETWTRLCVATLDTTP